MEGSNGPRSPTEATTSQALETPDSEKLKRKRQRQPRNSACQGCASLKMKCISTASGRCERCERMNRECIPAVPKPRKRRTESNAGIEGDQSVSLVQSAGPSSAAAGPAPRDDSLRSRQSDDPGRRSLLQQHDLLHNQSKSFVALFSDGLGNVAALDELLHGVDYNFVASCFTIFRQLTPHFPFIELNPAADVVAMVARRPCLTLAICVVTAAAIPETQGRLSQAFQYALSSKLVLGTERSIDLMTGLLVYLAWHHQYMSQRQIYQQLYLLAGTAADLGLYHPQPDRIDPASALERDRAFVGCYYLCCGLAATGFDKPSSLRWTINLRRCADSAATAGVLSTDRNLPGLLELAHTMHDLEDGIRDDVVAAQGTAIHSVELHAKATIQRLKALKREHAALNSSLAYAAATIHTYQRLLRVSDAPSYSVLIQCACAIKDYLEDILARPPITLHQVSILDWTNLLETLVLMSRIAKPPTKAGGWEVGALSEMLPAEQLLDALCAYMEAAAPNDPLSPRHEALLQLLRRMCDGIKRHMLRERGGANTGAKIQHDSEGRFRPVNEQARPVESDAASALNLLGNGVLDTIFSNTLNV